MSTVALFDFGGTPVRTLVDDAGEPWFVAKDVTNLLGYGHAENALRRLCDDEKTKAQVAPITTRTGPPPRPVWVVSESGLYSLILWSHKPEAVAFKRWIFHEVIPTIRKTGAYVAPGSDLASKIAAGDIDGMIEGLTLAANTAKQERAKQLAGRAESNA